MKLKKIASLALAGVMAVSMLAGCSNTSNNGGQPLPPPEDDDNTTGYSVTLGNKIEASSETIANMDYITFEDDADVDAALEKAVGNIGFGATTIGSVLPGKIYNIDRATNEANNIDGVDLMIDSFVEDLDIENGWLNVEGIEDAFNSPNVEDGDTVRAAALYVIDGTVEMDSVLNQVAADVDEYLEDLPNVNDDNTARVTYDYVVSASVVNKPVSVVDWFNGSANFIAVVVARIPTQA